MNFNNFPDQFYPFMPNFLIESQQQQILNKMVENLKSNPNFAIFSNSQNQSEQVQQKKSRSAQKSKQNKKSSKGTASKKIQKKKSRPISKKKKPAPRRQSRQSTSINSGVQLYNPDLQADDQFNILLQQCQPVEPALSFERTSPLNVLATDRKYFLDMLAEVDEIQNLQSSSQRRQRLFNYNPNIRSSIYEKMHAKILENKRAFA